MRRGPAVPVCRATGCAASDNIETVRIVEDGLRLSGWCRTGTVRFSWPDGQLDVRPDLPRSDVGRRIGSASHNLGFDVTLPPQARPLRISTLLPSGQARHVTIAHPADPRTPRARRRLRLAFCRDMIARAPRRLSPMPSAPTTRERTGSRRFSG
jgi:hypothetical protein